jgi:hypothetical protein
MAFIAMQTDAETSYERRLRLQRERRAINPEAERVRNRAYYARNLQSERARNRKRMKEKYWSDPEAARAKNRAHYRSTPSMRTAKREWMRTNGERFNAKATLQRRTAPYLYLVRKARHRAKTAGLACEIDAKWAAERWTGKCELTGIDFVTGTGKTHPYSASIDRKDPAIGYTKDNSRFILLAVNRFKGEHPETYIYEIAALLLRRSDP